MPSKLKEWQVTHTARTRPEEIAEEMLREYIKEYWPEMLTKFPNLGVEWDIADAAKITEAFKSADVMLIWKECTSEG